MWCSCPQRGVSRACTHGPKGPCYQRAPASVHPTNQSPADGTACSAVICFGVAVIGGVITSTFLTLLVIPTGYEILDEWRHAFMRWMGATPKQMTAEHAVPSAGD